MDNCVVHVQDDLQRSCHRYLERIVTSVFLGGLSWMSLVLSRLIDPNTQLAEKCLDVSDACIGYLAQKSVDCPFSLAIQFRVF